MNIPEGFDLMLRVSFARMCDIGCGVIAEVVQVSNRRDGIKLCLHHADCLSELMQKQHDLESAMRVLKVMATMEGHKFGVNPEDFIDVTSIRDSERTYVRAKRVTEWK